MGLGSTSRGSPQRPAHYGIRTDDAKLIYYDGLTDLPAEQRWEFYDLAGDPQETRNAAGEVQHARTIEQLKERLARLQRELGDRP